MLLRRRYRLTWPKQCDREFKLHSGQGCLFEYLCCAKDRSLQRTHPHLESLAAIVLDVCNYSSKELIAQRIDYSYRGMTKLLLNNEMERVWKESVMA